MPFTNNLKFVKFRIYGNLWEKKESSDMMFIFDPQCHTLVTFFLNLPSCETQLATVINDWAKILDNKGQVDTFILDFEKAFDTPPHELLKSKLFSYGIGGKALK